MIIALYGNQYLIDKSNEILKSNFDFQIVGLKDLPKRICDQIFDFKVSNLWQEKNTEEADTRYFRENKNPKYLTSNYALNSLMSWGNDCYNSIWADYAINVAKTLCEDTEFDDYANYRKEHGIEFLHHSNKLKNVCLTDISSLEEIKKIKHNNIKIIKIDFKNQSSSNLNIDFDFNIEIWNENYLFNELLKIMQEV